MIGEGIGYLVGVVLIGVVTSCALQLDLKEESRLDELDVQMFSCLAGAVWPVTCIMVLIWATSTFIVRLAKHLRRA